MCEHLCTQAGVRTHTHTHTHTRMHAHTHALKHTFSFSVCISHCLTHSCMCLHMHTHTQTRTRMHVHALILCVCLSVSVSLTQAHKHSLCPSLTHPLLVDLFIVYFKLICDNKDIVFAWVLGHVASGERMLLTWQLNVLRRSLSIREWRFLTLILWCRPICIQRSCGKLNEKDIQRISYIRFNPKWIIPFRLMIDVATRKLYYADCILFTLFKTHC